MGYGSGAIMAVPGARRARLRVRHEVRPADRRGHRAAGGRRRRRRPAGRLSEAYAGDGAMVNSGRSTGWRRPGEAFAAVVDWLGERGLARRKVNF